MGANVSRLDREKWRQETDATCPHHVDLTPPPDGYGDLVGARIMDFLESRIGSFDMYVAVDDRGEPFVRYCFEREADANPSMCCSGRRRKRLSSKRRCEALLGGEIAIALTSAPTRELQGETMRAGLG